MVRLRVVKALKIGRIITWVLIVLYLLLCFIGFCFLRLSNLSFYVILSGSMQPEINIDDVVVSRNLSEAEVIQTLSIGDVATYDDGQSYVTHRVYDKSTDKKGNTVFIFKGDNNNTIDRYSVRPEQIKGVQVNNLRNFAWMFEFLNSTYGTITLISLLLLLFVAENTFAYAVKYQQSKLQSENEETLSVNDQFQTQN